MDEQSTSPAEPEASPPADDTSSVDALREELDQARAAHQRAVADYQNLLRRSRDERAEIGRSAIADAVGVLLPVLDDLDRALDSVHDEIREHPWVEGVRLVAQKCKSVLEAQGVQEIHALGQPFDPSRHDAVGSAPGPEGMVVHLVRRGYALADRVVRPAMVMVGAGEQMAPAHETNNAAADAGKAEQHG